MGTHAAQTGEQSGKAPEEKCYQEINQLTGSTFSDSTQRVQRIVDVWCFFVQMNNRLESFPNNKWPHLYWRLFGKCSQIRFGIEGVFAHALKSIRKKISDPFFFLNFQWPKKISWKYWILNRQISKYILLNSSHFNFFYLMSLLSFPVNSIEWIQQLEWK